MKGEKLFDSLRNIPNKKTTVNYIVWIAKAKYELDRELFDDKIVPRLMHCCFRHLEVRFLNRVYIYDFEFFI